MFVQGWPTLPSSEPSPPAKGVRGWLATASRVGLTAVENVTRLAKKTTTFMGKRVVDTLLGKQAVYAHPLAQPKALCTLEGLKGSPTFGLLKILAHHQDELGELGPIIKKLVAEPESSAADIDVARFLLTLRKALSSDEYLQVVTGHETSPMVLTCAEALDELCYRWYMHEQNTTFAHSLMKSYLEGIPEEESYPKIFEKLERVSSDLPVPRWKKRLYRRFIHLELAVDAHLQGNLPYPNMRLAARVPEEATPKLITGIRMASQAIRYDTDWAGKKVVILPEFLGYLRHLKRTGKCHLYVNLQNRNHPAAWKPEREICRTLETLEQEFPGVIYVVTLENNSDFYWQGEEWSHNSSYAHLRQELIQRLQEDQPESGFHFSLQVRGALGENFPEEVAKLADQVHQHYFAGREELTDKERHNLLDILYTYLIEALVLGLEADFFNISCKHAKDRGGAGNAMLFLRLGESSGQIRDPVFQGDAATLLVSPSLFFKGELPKSERISRFLSLADLLHRREPQVCPTPLLSRRVERVEIINRYK